MNEKFKNIYFLLIGMLLIDIFFLFLGNFRIIMLLLFCEFLVFLNYMYKKNLYKKSILISLIAILTFLFLIFKIYEVALVVMFIFIIFIFKKVDIKYYPIILLVFSFIIRFIFILLIDTPPVSDFWNLLNASKSILHKDYSFNNDSYFYTWAYQIGFVYIQSIFLRIINSVFFLKIINCLVGSLICVLIYLISKEFVSKKSAMIVSILYSLFIFPLTFTSVLTNQHLSALLIYLGLYILIKDNKQDFKNYWKYIIAGLLISLGNIIRPEGIITIISLLLYFIFQIRKNNIKYTIKKFLTILITYFSVFYIISGFFVITGIGPNGLKNNAPQWKFVLGFDFDTNGSYSYEDSWTLDDKIGGYKLVLNRIKDNYEDIPKLFINKSKTFWTDTTLQWSFYHLNDEVRSINGINIDVNTLISDLNNTSISQYFIMIVLSIVGVYKLFKSKTINNKVLIIFNQVTITFAVYLLIEVQPRYSYFVQISIFILAGYGIEFILDLKNKKNKIRNKEKLLNCL